VELLRDDDVQHVIDRMIVGRIAKPNGVRRWTGAVGRCCEHRQRL